MSILDIVNDSALQMLTVGNHPSAVTVSSDGSYAYVANYSDSTISRVDLKAQMVSGTLQVGGNPTSVAITNAGILWVGGSGFLTEINTASMTVVGTAQVVGKSIIALGYSDQLSELIATSTDASANVTEDEYAPANFQAGTNFVPTASHTIATLGTYTNQITQQQVRAFTSTLSNSSQISTNQTGAPPLVVQDGWVVVTATPTGFTISDASSHTVLVSQSTPSPVTAIAVDTNLDVAYLVMPDSNTMLTVPLPGASTSSSSTGVL